MRGQNPKSIIVFSFFSLTFPHIKTHIQGFALSGGTFMKYQLLTEEEMQQEVSGAALTLTAVMAVLATAIIAVIVYRMFMSKKGSASVPGGWKFSWN